MARRLFVEGVAMRGIGRTLGIHRTTVARKLIFLARRAEWRFKEQNKGRVSQVIEFDDLETCETTKYQPVSVTLAVESKSRQILGFAVSAMPSKVALSVQNKAKYLPREDERAPMRAELFKALKPFVHKNAIIKSDQNPHYVKDVKDHFPDAEHITFKGRKPASIGQGELKMGGFDPLFSLNHTCAMLRARMSRLVRKTWSISKKKEKLKLHLSIYVAHHNQTLKEQAQAKLRRQSIKSA